MARPPLKLIEWEDAYNGNHSWCRRSELSECIAPKLVRTVGFELQRDAGRVTLAMSVEQNVDDPNVCDLFTIPISMIRKERTLR